MTDTLLAFVLSESNAPLRLRYQHKVNGRTFSVDTADIQAEVGDIPLGYPPLRQWLREYIAAGEAGLACPY
jgi:hypothetical protein